MDWKPEDDYKILGLSTSPEEWAEKVLFHYGESVGPDGVVIPKDELEAWFANCIETAKRMAVANLPFRTGRPTF